MKKELRKEMINRRLSLTREEIEKYSRNLSKKIERLKCYQDSFAIGGYMPIKNEIELFLDKITCYPKVIDNDIVFLDGKDFKVGAYNVLEPNGKEVHNIDLVFVPLVACDKNNNRIGYGKGYYDRFLRNFKGKKIGVCYDFQMVESIISDTFDVPLDEIVCGDLND